jgi:ribonucleoside-diphosphate reductase alpha chain
MPGDVSKKYLHEIHFKAWKKGIKSLYYSRSTSIQRADKVSHAVSTDKGMADLERKNNINLELKAPSKTKYDECLSCQ